MVKEFFSSQQRRGSKCSIFGSAQEFNSAAAQSLCTQHPFDSLVSGAHRTNEPRHDCSWRLAPPRPVTVVQVNRQFLWLAWNLQHYPDGYLAWALFPGSQSIWEIESPEEKVCRDSSCKMLPVIGWENGLLLDFIFLCSCLPTSFILL